MAETPSSFSVWAPAMPERKYCSRTCCLTAVKNALMIKEADPQARVAILYRDMQMYGIENEALFRQSKATGGPLYQL